MTPDAGGHCSTLSQATEPPLPVSTSSTAPPGALAESAGVPIFRQALYQCKAVGVREGCGCPCQCILRQG
eukprot:13495749-Alexandrium_andersonii.AAC.1